MPNFDGRAALITAGATGIGFACAERIIEGGGRVLLCARREESLLSACKELGPAASYAVCDVSRPDDVAAAVESAVERFGGLHLAVNAAGMGNFGMIRDTPTEHFRDNLDLNLVGSFNCLKAEANAMAESGGGSIVNVSSEAGVLAHPGSSGYCVSKAALNMLTRCAADEFGELGIRVNAVIPSIVRTEMSTLLWSNDFARKAFLDLMAIPKVGEPADVAPIITFLLSEEAGWMTGQLIGVDGGTTIGHGPNLVPLFHELRDAARRDGEG
ncbi:MAG: SDR family oxidoreductase [bacterium]|nr:SDR family oxidoreductase [bacterium]